MRFFFSILTVILLFPLSCLAGQGIPESRQFIMDNPAEADTPLSVDSTWTPTREDTRKALDAITAFLNDPDSYEETIKYWTTDIEYAKGELDKIRTYYSRYGVQFYGILEGGKRFIHCNFGPADEMGTKPLAVSDGGFWHWQIVYDMETGNLIELSINGYA